VVPRGSNRGAADVAPGQRYRTRPQDVAKDTMPSRRIDHDDPYRLLLEMTSEAVLLGVDGRVALANGAAALLFGAATAGELEGLPLADLVPEVASTSTGREYPKRRSVRRALRRIDGSTFDALVSQRACAWTGRPATQVVVRTATKVEAPAPLTDPLTALPSRRQFDERLRQAIDRAARSRQPVWVLYADLDHFHRVNAAHGHRVGDAVLLEAATRLQACVRKTDLVASAGGDEFLIALEGTQNREGATVVAGRALQALARPFEVNGATIELTASLGLTAFPDDGADPDRLLRNADVALWQAKAGNRNRHEFFSPQMDDRYRRSQVAQAAIARRFASLTPREREVLERLVSGEANKMIAYELGASPRTIEQHRAKIMEKMDAGSLAELVRMAVGRSEA
jgi:diguanylate cyclase (GGDEF)-like protein